MTAASSTDLAAGELPLCARAVSCEATNGRVMNWSYFGSEEKVCLAKDSSDPCDRDEHCPEDGLTCPDDHTSYYKCAPASHPQPARHPSPPSVRPWLLTAPHRLLSRAASRK